APLAADGAFGHDRAMEDERPVLDQLNLVDGDVAGMVDFYRALGLDIPDEPPPWDRHHRSATMPEGVEFDIDSAEFAPRWNAGWAAGSSGVVIGFRVSTREAVDRTYGDLTALGHRGQQEPYDAFWGSRYAIVTDPAGNAVGIMSPMEAARQTAPPDM